jgi:hypothetical protein
MTTFVIILCGVLSIVGFFSINAFFYYSEKNEKELNIKISKV